MVFVVPGTKHNEVAKQCINRAMETWLLVACDTGIYEICGIKCWVNHDSSQLEEIYFSSNYYTEDQHCFEGTL